MTVPGSAVPFPNPQGVDPRRIRMWDVTRPGRPEHGVGDLIVAQAPPAGYDFQGFDVSGWEFDGPVWMPGFDIRPRGTLAADYSTKDAPVLGLPGAVAAMRFSARARTHWDWARGRNAFVYLSNAGLDYRDNPAGAPCSFGDLFKIKVEGCRQNARPGRNQGPSISVLWQSVRMINGPHYVSNTVDPNQNGHTDGVQCMGGIDDIQAGDCYLQAAGIQMFFLGREASLCGYNAETLWRLTRVTFDHIPAWNPNVRDHDFNRHPKLIQGFEGEPKGIERTDEGRGQYLSTLFTDCNIRGPYRRAEFKDIRKYLSPATTVKGLGPDGLFQFDAKVRGRAKAPMYAGTLKYFEPGETLPTLCPAKHVGPAHRVTSPEQALAAALGSL